MKIHPLRRWLIRNELSPAGFASKCGVAARSIHYLLSGDPRNPTLKVLQAVEDGTNRRVTVQKLSDWARANAS